LTWAIFLYEKYTKRGQAKQTITSLFFEYHPYFFYFEGERVSAAVRVSRFNNPEHMSHSPHDNQPAAVPPARDHAGGRVRPPFIGIAVAASTGGPDTLLRFFAGLPVLPGAAVFVVLHGPAWMLKSMAGMLQKKTGMTVRLGEDGMVIRAGEVYLAPGDRHMVVDADTLHLRLTDDPPENYVKPAADPLFRSVASAFGRYAIGIVMTGMGHDGSAGCGSIAAAGGVVLVQDPLTAVIDSMPRAVMSHGFADEIAAIPDMPGAIARSISSIMEQDPPC
jgi:two-component system, chemotaxis family, protein-glutamate methylesterase/glutaminase